MLLVTPTDCRISYSLVRGTAEGDTVFAVLPKQLPKVKKVANGR